MPVSGQEKKQEKKGGPTVSFKKEKKSVEEKKPTPQNICAIMKKFYFTAALSFIILLCLEDAQGQYLSRSLYISHAVNYLSLLKYIVSIHEALHRQNFCLRLLRLENRLFAVIH